MVQVPDHPCGTRFCKQCCSFLPLSEFYSGVRRHECKRHASERARRYRISKPQDEDKRAIVRVSSIQKLFDCTKKHHERMVTQ